MRAVIVQQRTFTARFMSLYSDFVFQTVSAYIFLCVTTLKRSLCSLTLNPGWLKIWKKQQKDFFPIGSEAEKKEVNRSKQAIKTAKLKYKKKSGADFCKKEPLLCYIFATILSSQFKNSSAENYFAQPHKWYFEKK